MNEQLTTRTTNLYQVNQQIDEILESSVDQETGEINEEAFERLNALELSKQEIIKHTSLKFKDLQMFIERYKAEKARISETVKQMENLSARIKEYLKKNVTEKIRTPEFEISFRKSEAVEIDEFTDLPALHKEFPEIVEEVISYKASKTAAKEYYKTTGLLPKGFSIVENKNIQIK